MFTSRLKDADVEAIVDTICSGLNVAVGSLDVSYNELTDAGAEALAKMLRVRAAQLDPHTPHTTAAPCPRPPHQRCHSSGPDGHRTLRPMPAQCMH